MKQVYIEIVLAVTNESIFTYLVGTLIDYDYSFFIFIKPDFSIWNYRHGTIIIIYMAEVLLNGKIYDGLGLEFLFLKWWFKKARGHWDF